MRDHPIPPVTEPLQYRAIGIVRGIYKPYEQDQITRGHLIDTNGLEIEAVVLGRVLTLMRRHLDLNKPHLWVVYPRCREADHLHLQIAGIWEPSTLEKNKLDIDSPNKSGRDFEIPCDELPEGDDYFSIRGELIYTKPDTEDLVLKVRQRSRTDGSRPLPFKLNLKGRISIEYLRHFVSLKVRRHENQLFLEEQKVIGPLPNRGSNKRRGGKKSVIRKSGNKQSQGL